MCGLTDTGFVRRLFAQAFYIRRTARHRMVVSIHLHGVADMTSLLTRPSLAVHSFRDSKPLPTLIIAPRLPVAWRSAPEAWPDAQPRSR